MIINRGSYKLSRSFIGSGDDSIISVGNFQLLRLRVNRGSSRTGVQEAGSLWVSEVMVSPSWLMWLEKPNRTGSCSCCCRKICCCLI